MPTPATSDFPADLAHSPRPELELSAEPLQVHPSAQLRASSPMPLRSEASLRPEHIGVFNSHTPSRPGVSHAAILGSHTRRLPWFHNRTNRMFVLSLLLGALFIAHSKGAFRSDAGRREAAWERDGVRAGDYDDARHFLAEARNHFEALPSERLLSLLDGLERAGAKHVWVIEIESRGSEKVSRTLLVELPNDTASRQTIFFQHAQGVMAHVPADTGQTVLRIAP